MELSGTQLAQLHQHLLELLKIFHSFCEQNNLKYYLLGGSAIGALRHGGIIPWDDDIDVALPRNDYEKLLRIYPKEGIGTAILKTNRTNRNDHVYPWTKLEDSSTHLVVNWHKHIKPKTGVFLDIFPLDGAPDDKNKRLSHIDLINHLKQRLYTTYFNYQSKNFVKRMLLPIYRTNICRYIITTLTTIVLKRYSYDSSYFAGNLLGEYGIKEIVPKDLFGAPREVSFGSLKSYIPEKAEEYLTHIYGEDWMLLPPPEKRILPHEWSELIFNTEL